MTRLRLVPPERQALKNEALPRSETVVVLSEMDMARCEKEVAKFIERRRPPPHIRAKLDLGFRLQGLSVEIFEIRPRWDNKDVVQEHPVAKATYIKTKQHWKVFWMRADLKWHGYQPNPAVKTIEDFLSVVQEDQYGCFFG